MKRALLPLALLLAAAPAFAFVPAPGAPPYVLDHDHRDAMLHAATWNMVETDWEPMGGTIATTAGAHALALADGILAVAAWGEQFGAGGLWIYDVRTDPLDPMLLSRVLLPGPVGGDRAVGLTPDGDFAVVGVEDIPVTLYWGAPVNPTPPGLVLVDLRDPELPLIVGYAPAELGVHSVTMHRIGGQDYVYATTNGGLTTSVHRIERAPAPRLIGSGLFAGSFRVGHDATGYDDPLTGKPLLATADGWDFAIWDLSAPLVPKRLAVWTERSTYTHSALLTTIEGRRILVGSSEDWGDEPSRFWMIDATDLGKMKLLGSWTAPVPAGPGWLTFSLHNPRLEDGILYFAHYHAGVVAFDVSTLAKAASPQMVAFAATGHDTGYVSPGAEAMKINGWGGVSAPYVLDVELSPESGALYAADTFFGLTTYDVRLG